MGYIGVIIHLLTDPIFLGHPSKDCHDHEPSPTPGVVGVVYFHGTFVTSELGLNVLSMEQREMIGKN